MSRKAHSAMSIPEKAENRQSDEINVSRGKSLPALDLYSTLQENLEKKCINAAPYVFTVIDGHAEIRQTCCNSWECPRCGEIRAKQEFARMINGTSVLSGGGFKLFFLTLTCQGKQMPLSVAEIEYYTWTNRLLQACRDRAKKQNIPFHYAQVTERQKRGHPHSHIITNFLPDDAIHVDTLDRQGKRLEIEWSWWFIKRNITAGLGPQCQIQAVRDPVGIACYVAKYFFKDAMKTQWPPKWKRVRYSRQWPKLPQWLPEISFPLFTNDDWKTMDNLGMTVYTDNYLIVEMARARNIRCVRHSARPEFLSLD